MQVMDAVRLIDALERFADVLPPVVAGLTAEQARWRGEHDAWAIVEIVAHMADEETDDFRRRVACTLADPPESWPAIDPEGWAKERRYLERDLGDEVARFVRERRASIEWLRGLGEVDWAKAWEHPKFGAIRAGDLLAAWAAHDTLHLRQIAKRLFQMVERDAGSFSTAYAGSWTA